MRKLYAFIALSMLFFLSGGDLFAQSRIISGKVLDNKGNPVSGASVIIKSSRRGTTTTLDGVFSISVPDGAKTFVVSSVNFTTTEVAIADGLAIVLSPAISDLEQVVVVAYGSQKKTEITSAISTISAETIKNQQITTVGQALQGTASGVLVVNDNGQPGESPKIRIRGIASIGASADPLVVLDGIPFDGNLNMIAPGDIESFSVLKDAVATALYGSRGGNGVILINTKSGKRNSLPSIDLSATYGLSSRAISDYPYISTQQQFELGWEALRNTYIAAQIANPEQKATDNLIQNGFRYNPYGPTFPNPVGTDGKLLSGAKPLWNDNWTKALTTDNAARRNVSLGIGGGTDKSKYYFSAGYLDQNGYISKSDYNRISARFNYTTYLTDWLQIGAKTSIVSSKQNYPDQGSGTFSDVTAYGRIMSSVFPIYERDDNGNIIKDANGKPLFDYGKPDPNRTVNVNRPVLQPSNVVGTLALDNWTYDRVLTDLNVYGQVNFTKNLFFKTSFGINRSLLDELHYEDKDFGDASSVGGRVYREEDLTTSWTLNNMLGYEKHFGDHHIEAMISYEAYKYNYETIYGSKTGFAFSGQQQLTNATSNEDFEGYTVASTLLSTLGRLKYDFKGKYFAEFTGRRDAASIWAPGYRYGFFPAGGISWLISQEDFMQRMPKINLLKLRVSYGANGNDALLDGNGNQVFFPYLNTFASGNNDLTNPGVYLNQLANSIIQWEKQVTANVGVDFELFKSRLTGSVDVFQKTSLHLVLPKPLSPSSGFGSILTNVGKGVNSGVELNLGYDIVRGKDFNWAVSANVSFLKNKITELLPGIDTFAAQGAFRKVTGKSVYEFYLPVWAGVDPANGDGLWWIDERDANGALTGKRITTNDYTTAQTSEKWVGSGLPKITGGFSTKFSYKSIDLSILLNYAFGGKYYDNNYASLMGGFYNGYGSQLDADQLRRWSKAGDITNIPRLNADNGDAQERSTRFLYNGDYVRLRNITLGYSFNTKPVNKVLKGARVYIQADNIFTWDKLKKGSDPESDISGYAGGNAVVFKTFSFGLDFKF